MSLPTANAKCIQTAALGLGLLTNVFGGLVYIYPIYTSALQNALFLTDGQVTVIGTVAHFGLAIISYFYSLLYRGEFCGKLTPFKVDLVTNILTICLQVLSSVGLALLIDTYCIMENGVNLTESQKVECSAEHPVFGLVLVLYLLFRIGVGMGFAHAVWVSGANFHYNLKTKSAVVSSVSFAIGVGSMALVIGYHFLQQAQNPNVAIKYLFWFQASVFFLIGVARCFFMYRIDTTSLEEKSTKSSDRTEADDDASVRTTLTAAPESMLHLRSRISHTNFIVASQSDRHIGNTTKATTLVSTDYGAFEPRKSVSVPTGLAMSPDDKAARFDDLWRANGDQTDNYTDSNSTDYRTLPDENDSIEESGSQIVRKPNAMKRYCCSWLPQLTFWAVFFGIGLGGAYQSMLGFLSPLYANDGFEGTKFTFESLVVFLSFQVLARLICVIVYRFYRIQTLLLVVWELMEFLS